MARVKMLPFGTVSHGTMRPQDVIPAMLDALETVSRREAARWRGENRDTMRTLRKLRDDAEITDDEAEGLAYAWDSLDGILNDRCHPYTYFGAIEGDGSDYGVWVSHDAVEDAVHDGTAVRVSDPSALPSPSDPENGDVTEAFVVTDHGNLAYYVRGPRGRWRMVWDCV